MLRMLRILIQNLTLDRHFVLVIHNTMFCARTMKQSNVTLSSTESENSAAVEAIKDILWFRQLFEELGFPQSMIHLAENFSGNHKKVKHFMTRINFLIEQVHMNHIKFQHVSSDKNVADILTKPLGPCEFLRLRPHLLGAENFSCDRSDDRVGLALEPNVRSPMGQHWSP
jgi:hypothetical protein